MAMMQHPLRLTEGTAVSQGISSLSMIHMLNQRSQDTMVSSPVDGRGSNKVVGAKEDHNNPTATRRVAGGLSNLLHHKGADGRIHLKMAAGAKAHHKAVIKVVVTVATRTSSLKQIRDK